MARTKLEAFVDGEVQEAIQIIDEKLEKVNKKLEIFDKVKGERDKLVAARRALLGVGNRMTGNGGSRTTQDEVAQWMRDKGALHVSAIAAGLSTNDAVIRGHLSRGKDERFLKMKSGRWVLRDPEAGINTADDYDENDEDGDEED